MVVSGSSADERRARATQLVDEQTHKWGDLTRTELEDKLRELSIDQLERQLSDETAPALMKAQLDSIYSHTRYGLALLNPDGGIERHNAYWLEIMQRFYQPEGSSECSTIYQWADVGQRAKLIHDLQQVLEGHAVQSQYQSGKLWLDVQYHPVKGADGNIIGATQWLTDISEERNNRRALEIREAQNRQILDILPVGVGIIHRDTFQALYANNAMQEIAEPAFGQDGTFLKWFNLLDTTQRERVMDQMDRVRNHNEVVAETLTFSLLSGASVTWRIIVCAIEFANENAIMSVVEDITEVHQREEDERETRLHQERMRLIAEFIQDAAHEFKTPLSNIHTSTYMLRRTNEPTERNEKYLNRIENNTGYITQLVEAMLTMARLDAGVDLEFATCDLHHLLEHAVLSLALKADENEVLLSYQATDPLPKIWGDQKYLVQAFTNLIANALNHVEPEEGVVLVKATVLDQQIQITVQDNGRGMSAEVQERALERFFRDDTAHSTRGFGLGLPIAEEVFKKHQGTLLLESVEGLGTLVTIHLPLIQTATDANTD